MHNGERDQYMILGGDGQVPLDRHVLLLPLSLNDFIYRLTFYQGWLLFACNL